MPAGRPSDYKPEYCDQVIEYGKAGKSRVWIATELDVCRQTLHNWEAAHPEFLDAMTRAALFAQRWWEDAGQAGMEADKFNSAVWAKNMSSRFEDWQEKKLLEHSGSIDMSTKEQRDAAVAAASRADG